MFEDWIAAEPARRFRNWERALWAVALLSLGSVAALFAYGRVGETRAFAELEQRAVAQEAPPVARSPNGTVLGSVEVPRLALRALVLEGTGESSMMRGAGHVRGTALPGESGNVALAAHRDLHFRALRQVRAGDVVRLRTTRGDREYRVEGTRVVLPSETSVLADDGTSRLTLITCYPFAWVGRAPRRFVVTARALPPPSGPAS